jgi:hypothetical protein
MATPHAIALSTLLLAGCAAISPARPDVNPKDSATADGPRAIVHFHSAIDPAGAKQWGLLFTHDDLVVVEQDRATGKLLNTPRYFETEFLNKMATVKGIPPGETRTFALEAGAYDWLVLVDVDGDGTVDGYLGTEASQGPLSSFEFLAGKEYFIDVGEGGAFAFRIEPDPTRDRDQNENATYLALMDSVAERLPEMADDVLKQYVELVVEEIDALRRTGGDLCYDLIQQQGANGVRAYEALPPRLRIRESAMIDRVLRSPRKEHPILSGDEADVATAPLMEELEDVYGEDVEILDDDELFAANKELGCRIHRDLLALTLRLPLETAAPLWRFMFSDQDDDDEAKAARPPVTNI